MPNTVDVFHYYDAVYRFLLVEVLRPLRWKELESFFQARQEQRRMSSLFLADILPTLACLSLGGAGEQTVPLAASWVLYIAAAQIFDDIRDEEGNKQSLLQQFGAEYATHMGLSTLALAQVACSHIRSCSPLSNRVVQECGYVLAFAAQSQTERVAYQVPSLEQYFTNIYKKTANIVATTLWSGACLSSSNPPQAHLDSLYAYGLAVGTIAQIEDDCRDLASDLSQGVFTIPVIFAMSNCTHPEYDQFVSLVNGRKTDAATIQRLIEAIVKLGGNQKAKEMALLYWAQACDALKDIPESAAKGYLESYVTPAI